MFNIKKQIWIFNFSNKDVYLEDLGIKIPKMTSLDLIKAKISEEKILKSAESGSIYKKSKYVTIRKGPTKQTKQILKNSNEPIVKKQLSGYDHKKESYEELDMDDFDFATKFGDGLEEDEG